MVAPQILILIVGVRILLGELRDMFRCKADPAKRISFFLHVGNEFHGEFINQAKWKIIIFYLA
jgi:hypothetical protein